MNERTRWAVALLLALATNALLLIVILLQTSGLLFLYGTATSLTDDQHVAKVAVNGNPSETSENPTAKFSKLENALNVNSIKFLKNMPVSYAVSRSIQQDNRLEKEFVYFSGFQDVSSKSDRQKIFQQELLDIVSGDLFVDKLLDSLIKRQRSSWEQWMSSQPTQSLIQNIVQDTLESQLSKHISVTKHGASYHPWDKTKLSRNGAHRDRNYARLTPEFIFERAQPYSRRNVNLNDVLSNVQNRSDHEKIYRKRREVELGEVQGDATARRSDVPPEAHYEPTFIQLEEVFSALTDTEIAKLPEEVRTILLPALIHFETMVIRQLETLHSAMIAHDLRLETLEKNYLNWLRDGGGSNNTNNDNNNNSEDMKDVIGEEFIPVNGIDLDFAGSGDGEDVVTTPAPTTTTTTSPTAPDRGLYELYRILTSLEQKVMALENYNVMSDSELIRTRNEVIKMDDRVTEMDRRHRNLQIRTTLQNYRVTELESFMSKTELALHTTLDAFSRMGQTLDAFKDRMNDYKTDIREVQTQFGRQYQIMTELRSADSYKAHDINELRKSLHGLEERLNSLYRVLDHNVDTVRGDIRTMIQRMCTNNNLSC